MIGHKFLSKPVSKSTAIVLIVATFFLLLSFLPEIYEARIISKLPSDRVMIWGEHNYTYDYNVYLSKIRQGMEGRWTVVDKYDNTTKQKGVYLQMLYLLSGKVGGGLGLTPVLVYQLLRVILGFAWIVVIITMAKYFLKKPSTYVPAVILSLLASSFPIINQFSGKLSLSTFMYWWQELDVARRMSYIPHYSLNYILLSLLIVLMYLLSKTNRRKYLAAICVILFFSFFIHPAGGLTFFFSWIIFHSIKGLWFRDYTLKDWLNIINYTLVIFLCAILPLLYIKTVTSSYPWKSLVDFDITHPLPFKFHEYILSLGSVFFTGMAGIILVLKQKNRLLLGLSSWALAAFFGLAFFSLVPIQSPVRFVQTANHVPLTILTVYFLTSLRLPGVTRVITVWIKWGFVFITVMIGLINGFSSLKGQMQFIHDRTVAVFPLVPVMPQIMYPLKDFYFALDWLSKNTQKTDVIFSKSTAGNYIPAYSGNFVYLGHSSETPHFDEREQKINVFFSFTQESQQAQQFLRDNHIAYVFYGPQERQEGSNIPNSYSFLKPIYESYHVTIYKVL